MGTVTLREATTADIELLAHWQIQPHVVAATGDPEQWDWAEELGRDPAFTWHLVGEEDGRPIGYVQVIDPLNEETHYWGDVEPHLRALDIWLGDPKDFGRGLGTQVMGLALDRCFEDADVTAVIIDPLATNTRSHRFYERLGFDVVGPRVLDGDECLIYRLDRERWQS